MFMGGIATNEIRVQNACGGGVLWIEAQHQVEPRHVFQGAVAEDRWRLGHPGRTDPEPVEIVDQ
jgi:hypothetical protein